MQIAFIHPRFPSAEGTGATHSATQIVTGLVNSGHDVCVYCTRFPEENPKTNDLELRHLAGTSNHPHTNTLLNKEVITRIDEFREFDVVHSYLTPLIPALAKVGECDDVRTIISLNAYSGICPKNDLLYLNQKQCERKSLLKCLNCVTKTGFKHSNYLYQSASELLSLRLINMGEKQLSNIDGFQALSPHVKETYSSFGFETDKISVIPNILDGRFDINHQTDFEEQFKILYIGSLKKSKGVDRLINVFSQVHKQADVSLTVVGEGPLRESLEKSIQERSMGDVVELKGQMPYTQLPTIYANHDVFLYPGRWNEPFGRVFLEAMATGTPVVSTDVGSVGDIIGDAGIITEQDTISLSKGLLSILDQQSLLACSLRAKQRIEKYRNSEVIPQFEQLYTTQTCE
ncbi:glycosyltransferase family 4 protein [Natrialba asiatica]|uniref:Glycosyltransferase, type 1 n=1 Tax=Natrialba asiatica (strain ATCC 700177 / DSM 12278 / JCM 9576 / FERM P-10747 / NBRC 102637 / 172P1) TaxID=29540 RepID=M0AV34_NATA1|nr:glycosyltransferase family 4 protein [Natrialba asiatica]ELZ01818.1 glycosyltransferase, type 1 [Natrialba asiatica DSM 12278]